MGVPGKTAVIGALTTLALVAGPAPAGLARAGGEEPADLAFGAAAEQSSTAFGAPATRAVDGNTSGEFWSGSLTHTAEEAQPWWQADLGTTQRVDDIVVWNRTDCCAERLSDFWVLSSDRPITGTLDQARSQRGVKAVHIDTLTGRSVTVQVGTKTRYIRIQRAVTGYLSLAEVQAFGKKTIKPSGKARRWVRQNPFGAFLHYNMSTYDDQQWADPDADEDEFQPAALDPGQWAKSLKAAGMTFGVLTAKHHDGFALWDSAHSTHDVASSSYQGGKADVVRDYATAMRANGLKVGLYFSIWDRHNGDSLELVENQLTELLTRYGTIDYLWFDGWGWSVPYSTVPYQRVRDLIRRLSPGTVVANNDHLVTLQTSDVIVYEVPVQGMPPTTNARPTDASDTLDVNQTWFNTTQTGQPRPAAEVAADVKRLNAGNALYLLNIGPDKAGRIPADYVDRLREIGTALRAP